MSGEPRTLTHSVDIDLRGVTKLKSVTPQPTDQGVINGEATIFRFRVRDGERITLDLGRRQVEVVVNLRAGGGYPVAARDEAAELRAALAEMSDLVFTVLSAEEELGRINVTAEDYPEQDYRAIRDEALVELATLARKHDDRAALAASEGQP